MSMKSIGSGRLYFVTPEVAERIGETPFAVEKGRRKLRVGTRGAEAWLFTEEDIELLRRFFGSQPAAGIPRTGFAS